ncbi:MAG: helix-turn-helix domain-containing protein [Sphingobacteriaceae bacterium]|nr:helix-turn-helix domain-containing protein [Sphingobacteriaceae bacterium]
MNTQTFLTTLPSDEFKELLSECVKGAVKSEIDRILESPKRPDKLYLTRLETAKELNVTLPTLNAWEKAGILVPVRIGTRVRYKQESINESLKANKNEAR